MWPVCSNWTAAIYYNNAQGLAARGYLLFKDNVYSRVAFDQGNTVGDYWAKLWKGSIGKGRIELAALC